ncbi:MAG: hypothetical protein ACREJ2_05555, partial [Planctomycetota bacterium]
PSVAVAAGAYRGDDLSRRRAAGSRSRSTPPQGPAPEAGAPIDTDEPSGTATTPTQPSAPATPANVGKGAESLVAHQPGVTPEPLMPGTQPAVQTGTGTRTATAPDHPAVPGGESAGAPNSGSGPTPEVHAAIAISASVAELVAEADRKIDPALERQFGPDDWQDFTAVIGGKPQGAALADVPEEIYQEYETAEKALRQAIWDGVLQRDDESGQAAERARALYARVAPELPPGDGVYNIVQRLSWGERIRKKYLSRDVMLVPGERVLESENMAALIREFRLYLVYHGMDPIKQRHNRVILIGEIWRTERDHHMPDRALAAVHQALTEMAESIFNEDTRDENPIGALIPTAADTMAVLGRRDRLLDQYEAMVSQYDLFSKRQRDRLDDVGYHLKLESDARAVFDRRQAEFADLTAHGRWEEIKAFALTVSGERDKYGRTYAKENWNRFEASVEAALKAQSDRQLAAYKGQLKADDDGGKLVQLRTDVAKDTQIFGGIDAQNWDTLASNVNIKIVEVKQRRGEDFLAGIRTDTQNAVTKAALDGIMEKLDARKNELAALNMVTEYDGVRKDINDRINRFSQIEQAQAQQQFYLGEIPKQQTSDELSALMDKIRTDRGRFDAVIDIPKWNDLQRVANDRLDVLVRGEFVGRLTDLEAKARAHRNDLAALDDMMNHDLIKAEPDAKRFGMLDRLSKLNDLVDGYQRAAQIAEIRATIKRYNDALAQARNDTDRARVVNDFKALNESSKALALPQDVREEIRLNWMNAEAWRRNTAASQESLENAEAALRDGL